ncbi:MAG: [protein-PII] uridylyltransferase [Actinomycetota bacterium]|nr:MAG: [protein-PII] uridylyltransferase [Actinomycetota bacterium]
MRADDRSSPTVQAADAVTATAAYTAARLEILGRPGPSGPGRRRDLTDATDAWVSRLFDLAGADPARLALVAVGGYGRGELAPGSDLDLLLLHRGEDSIAALADRIWYPIWDGRIALDHSVRTPAEARRLAAQDTRVLQGILDARLVAGDQALADQVKATVLADWRSMAFSRLATLRRGVDERIDRHGELAHLLEPDLKESFGGLRDVGILRAVAASWVTDPPRAAIPAAHQLLLDVRDELHRSSGRALDRLLLQEQAGVAAALGFADADTLLRAVSQAGRAIVYASDLTWHRVGRLARPASRVPWRRGRGRQADRVPLAEGVVVHDGEVVLSADARPDRDPVLALRAAAAAAQAGLRLAPHTVDRLAAQGAAMPVPWPAEARDALVSLLGAGRPAINVWEALDQAGIITALLPEWDVVRSAPQHNPVHRFTVDRHLVETAVEAGTRTRRVSRPDLLVVGSLLHDIGKGRPGDHTEVGIDLVGKLGPHLGYDDDDSAVLVALTAHHLLLPDTATRRDLDDPATVAAVADAVGSAQVLDLLHALSESDAAATGPAAWSEWKQALVDDLVRRTHAVLAGRPAEAGSPMTPARLALAEAPGVQVLVEPGDRATTVTVAAPDRRGLLGTVAGVLAVHQLDVRAAHTESVGSRAVQVWWVQPRYGAPPDAALLGEDVRRALDGGLDLDERLQRRAEAYATISRPAPPPPRVDVVPGASERATVIEVRAHDVPALLHRVGRAIGTAGVDIVAARVATLGADVVDVFYLVGPDGEPLTDEHAAAVRLTVLDALPV